MVGGGGIPAVFPDLPRRAPEIRGVTGGFVYIGGMNGDLCWRVVIQKKPALEIAVIRLRRGSV